MPRPLPDRAEIQRAAPKRHGYLPPTLAPRGLSRTEAAAYIGVSATFFDQMVAEGIMPAAKRLHSRAIWDRSQLDRAFDALPDEGDGQHNDEWKAAV